MAKEYPAELLGVISDGLWWNGQWKPQRAAVNKLAETDFPGAIEHFSNTDPGKQHPEESYRFSRRIADEQSVEDALRFAESLDRPLSRGFALRAAVRSWAEEDVGAATRYVDGLEDGVLRSHAIDGLIREIWRTNPEESVTWAMSMPDPELRQETLRNLARVWRGEDHQADLRRILDHNDLSDADRVAIDETLAPE